MELLRSASIGSLTLFDHAPISISLHPLSFRHEVLGWRLNENILDDVVALKQVSDSISLYFVENSTDDVLLASIWEGNKAAIPHVGRSIRPFVMKLSPIWNCWQMDDFDSPPFPYWIVCSF